MVDLPDRALELYALDPSEFVPARDALAKELRSAGDRDAAQEVKGLRRPTRAAWALNQAARQDPGAVEELIEAGRELRRAQEGAVAGDDPSAMRAAAGRRRAAVRRLADAAVDVAGEAQRDEVEGTLEAASVDDAVGDELRAGTIEKSVSAPTGFGALAAMVPEGEPARRPKVDRSEQRRLERRLQRADDDLERSEAQLARAEKRLADAQEAVDRARDAVAHDREARDQLRAELGGE